MPLNLPAVELGLLPKSPLELVVCQVRHPDRPVNVDAALEIHEALGGPDGFFTRIEQVEMRVASLVVSPGVATTTNPTESFSGWHLKSADGTWTAALLPGHFSLETTNYTRWPDFAERLSDLTSAVARVLPPVMEQRVGLRYVDRLAGLGVKDPADWEPWISPSILGPALHPVVGSGVKATRQQIDLELEDGHACVLRHGTTRDADAPVGGELSYLLDFDVYRSQSRRFEASSITAAAHRFHEQADSLFSQVITADLLAELRTGHNG